MKYDRLKTLFAVCDLNELDSIDVLLTHVKNYDLDTTNKVFKNLHQKQWDKNRSKYEGMNEYDDIARISNFDITKIPEYAINPYELIYLKKLMEDAIINIKENQNELDLRILSNIEETLGKINLFLNQLNDLSDIITEEELKTLFNKFNIIEIEGFDYIFEYMEEYNIEKMVNISNKVRNEKIENAYKEFEVFVKPYSFDIFELSNKKGELSQTELKFLCTILDDAILGLICYRKECDKLQDEKYAKLEASLCNLHESYFEELICRNAKTYKKTIL